MSKACGRGCTRCCWRGSTPPIRSTGDGPRSIPPRCGPLGGREHRSEPSRPPKTGLQAPRLELWAGHAARRPELGRQRQRHHEVRGGGGCRAAGARAARAAQAKTETRLRRSRLPLARVSARAAPAHDQGPGRPAQRPARLRARPPTLGGRADDLLVAPAPAPTRPLRAPRRHPPSVPDHRLLPDLLQAASGRGVILIRALRNDPAASPRVCATATTASGRLRGRPPRCRTGRLVASSVTETAHSCSLRRKRASARHPTICSRLVQGGRAW